MDSCDSDEEISQDAAVRISPSSSGADIAVADSFNYIDIARKLTERALRELPRRKAQQRH